MRRALTFFSTLAAALALALPALGGERLTLEEAPPEVQETIRKYVPQGELHLLERERDEGGGTYYKVEFTGVDGTDQRLEINEEGMVIAQRGRLN